MSMWATAGAKSYPCLQYGTATKLKEEWGNIPGDVL